MSMTMSRLNFCRIFDRQLAGEGHRLGIVAVDVEDRRLDAPWRRRTGKATSARTAGEVVKPTWLLMMKWMQPPVA